MGHFLYLQLFAHDVMGVAEYGEECVVDGQQGEEALHVVVDQWGLRVNKERLLFNQHGYNEGISLNSY